MAYDAANRLVRVDYGSTIALYTYNGLGQRVMKNVNGQITYFHYDLDGKMIAETPGGGSVTQGSEYIYTGKNITAKVDVDSGQIYSYHTNYLGAVHQLTNAQGIIVWEGVYQPFGDITVNAGSIVSNNWRMPGQYHDQESGLYYNYHRYYDPEIGRYLRVDPIGLEGGINPYVYVQNSPVSLIDPNGLTALEYAIPIATGCAFADSPLLPFGDILGGAIVSLAWLYDYMEDYDSMMEKKYGGYREGKPNPPEDYEPDPNEPPVNGPNTSKDFEDYIRWKEGSYRKNEWNYIMQKYWNPKTGQQFKRHFWRHKSGRTYYHLR